MYFKEALAEPMEICEGMMPTGDEGRWVVVSLGKS